MRLSNIEDTDLAYLAGIIDGEGCLMIAKMEQPRIVVAMNTPYVPTWINWKIPGGTLRHRQVGNERRSTWGVYSKEMTKGILEAVLPYLKLKEHQARAIIEFCNSQSPRERRDAACELAEIKRKEKARARETIEQQG